MKSQSPENHFDDQSPVKSRGQNRAILYNAVFPYGFENYNTLDSTCSRIFMIRRAAALLEKNPESEELGGYLRLVAWAGVLDPDVVVRSNAFGCLAELHDEVDLCWLLAGLKDVDVDARANCVQGIGWIGKRKYAKYLLPLLNDRAVDVRGLVLLFLPELLTKPQAIQKLFERLTTEKNPALRAICYYLLLSKDLLSKDIERTTETALRAEPQPVRSLTEKLKRGKDPDELLSEL